MAVAVDFASSFWVGAVTRFFQRLHVLQGDKHMGFSTLYHNMKCGQYAVKELSEFLKETGHARRGTLQVADEEPEQGRAVHPVCLDDHGEQVSVFASGTDHNCTSLWILTKNSLERAQQTSTRLHAALTDVLKDTHTYADELHKAQRELKHKATTGRRQFDANNDDVFAKGDNDLSEHLVLSNIIMCAGQGNVFHTMH